MPGRQMSAVELPSEGPAYDLLKPKEPEEIRPKRPLKVRQKKYHPKAKPALSI